MDERIKRNREWMKSYSMSDWDDPANESLRSDQQKGVAPPPVQKAYDVTGAAVVPLPELDETILLQSNLLALITQRRSRRQFSEEPLSDVQLSYLLWATQGVRSVNEIRSFRTVPSAGSRHPFETYLVVQHVTGLEAGVYRYLPLQHQLLWLGSRPALVEDLHQGVMRQRFASAAPVCFVWACVPYRCEWRYHTKASKAMLLDAGHICQNLYLAAESIGCGTCGIGAYWQEGMDSLLGIDGVDEFTVYLAPVGKPVISD